MTKLRARLLVSLILAVVSLAAIGVGTSWALPRADHGSRSGGGTLPGPRVTPMSGEPDAGSHTSPPTTVRPTVCFPGMTPWFAMLWYQWAVDHHQKRASGH